MAFIQIKISDKVAALLEEAKQTGGGFEFKSSLHGLDLQVEPGAKDTIKGSFSNFKVVAEPQIVIEERNVAEPEIEDLTQEPAKVISIAVPHSKEKAIDKRRNLLVACLQRGYKPGMTQAEIKILLKDYGVECSTTTVNQDLNELKRRGVVTSYSERGLGTVYKVNPPAIESLGF